MVAYAAVPSHSLSGHLPYIRRHITVNKIIMLSASLNKTYPSFK